MREGLVNSLFFRSHIGIGIALVDKPFLQEAPAVVHTAFIEEFMSKIIRGFKLPDTIPLTVVFLASKFGEINGPIDVVEVAPVFLSSERRAVLPHEFLGNPGKTGPLRETGVDRFLDPRFPDRREEIGRLEVGFNKNAEVSVAN
jgi:hypothetical protein